MSNTINSQGFHHVAINAGDFDASVRFYREGLGFPIIREWSGDEPASRAAMLDTGNGSAMEIFERPGVAASTGTIFHFALHVTDTAAAHRQALEAGATEKMPPTEIDIPSSPPLPVTISFVIGPEGEEIEFFQER